MIAGIPNQKIFILNWDFKAVIPTWFHRFFCVRAVSKFGHSFITNRMEVKKIFQAILSGKSREEVYNMLSPEERDKLNSLAAANGINRQQRRKLERDAKKGLHRRTAWIGGQCPLHGLLPPFPGYPMERLERLERVLHWVIPLAVLARVISLCLFGT